MRTPEEKLELLAKLENCSKLEAKQVIADSSETLFRAGGVSVPLSQNDEMPFRPNAGLKEKLKRLKEVTGVLSLEELVEQMADLGLKTWDPLEKAKRALNRNVKREMQSKEMHRKERHRKKRQKKQIHEEARENSENEKLELQKTEMLKENLPIPEPKRRVEKTRAIRMTVRHAVQLRDEGRCVNCGASTTLQFDHIEDFARGGSSETENLRLLCRSCNQRHAIESYGLEKMSHYLKSRELDYH